MSLSSMHPFSDKEPKWIACPKCGVEFACLTEQGICIECVELAGRIDKEKKIKQNEKERKDIYD